MCLQLHVSVDSGGPELLLKQRLGPSRGAESDTFETPWEDISGTHTWKTQNPLKRFMYSYVTEPDTER